MKTTNIGVTEVRCFAEAAHGGKKYGEHPYSYHLQSVALCAIKFGFGDDEDIMKACYLHDILEDTKIKREDLERLGVSEEVIEIVECVTDGKGDNRDERKAIMYPRCSANRKAVVVKLCDRIANVEESIKTKSRQFTTYFMEQPAFESHLRKEGELEEMWNYLNRILSKAN